MHSQYGGVQSGDESKGAIEAPCRLNVPKAGRNQKGCISPTVSGSPEQGSIK